MAKHTVLTELVGTVSGGNGPVKKRGSLGLVSYI